MFAGVGGTNVSVGGVMSDDSGVHETFQSCRTDVSDVFVVFNNAYSLIEVVKSALDGIL